MSVANCPRCAEAVSLPPGLPPEAVVRCPLCQVEYAASEVFDKLPPRLIVVSLPAAAPIAALASMPVAAPSAGMSASDDESLAVWDDPSAEAGAASETAPADDDVGLFGQEDAPPAEMFGDDNAALDTLADESILPSEGGSQVELAPESAGIAAEEAGFSYEESAAPTLAKPRITASARPRKSGGGLFQMVGVIGGGFMALPLAQLILWWLPGSLSRDPVGLGAPTAEYAPWLVPAKFHKQKTGALADTSKKVAVVSPDDAARANRFENGGPTDPAVKVPTVDNAANPLDPTAIPAPGDMPDEKTEPAVPADPGDPTDPANFIPSDPFAVPTPNPTDPAAVPGDNPPPKPPVNPTDPFTDPAAVPSVNPDDPANPLRPDPLDPAAKPADPLDPNPTEKPPVPVDPKPPTDPVDPLDPADPKPVPPTDPVPTDPAPTDPTPLPPKVASASEVIQGAPAVAAEQATAALSGAEEVEKLWDALAADAPKEDRRKVAGDFRLAFAALGTAATYGADLPAAKVEALLQHLAGDEGKLRLTAVSAASWLAATDRGTPGVLLFGTVKETQPAGDYFATTLELNTNDKTPVVVLTREDVSAAVPAGARWLVLGAIVDDAATQIKGYTGAAQQAVFAGQHYALPKP